MEHIKDSLKDSGNTKDSESNCKVCGEPLFVDIELFGKMVRKRAICSCRVKQIEENKARLTHQEDQRRLEEVKRFSLIDEHFEKKTFDVFEIDEYNEQMYKAAFNYCENFDKARKENLGLLFFGPPGIGKTFTTACIANRLLGEGITVVCLRADAIINRIYESYGNNRDYGENEILRKINESTLLILDDLGTEHSSKSEKEKQIIYSVIDGRLRSGKPLICTTNLDLRQLKDKLTGYDGVSRTYDRLMEMVTPIKVNGVSKRVLAAREKQKNIDWLFE